MQSVTDFPVALDNTTLREASPDDAERCGQIFYDAFASIAERHEARVVRVAHRQIAATRNSGARAAMGELFIFVDADTIVTEAVVRAAVDAMRGGAVGGGAFVKFDGGVPWYAKLLMPVFAWFYRASGLAAGCFLFCSRDAFVTVGGFDETFFASSMAAFAPLGKFASTTIR